MKKFNKYIAGIAAALMVVMPLNAAAIKSISKDNTTLVPLRMIGEELNAKVQFDAEAQQIIVVYKDNIVSLKLGSKEAVINGSKRTLAAAPIAVDGTTYVPLRFIGEALGAKVSYANNVVTVMLDEQIKSWTLETKASNERAAAASQNTFKKVTQSVKGKAVKYVVINMNDSKVQVKIKTAGNKINQAASLKDMTQSAKALASINGTYFAAYNGDMPLPDGTVVKDGKTLHITDIGCTVGFTKDNKVLIDFVTTRVQGYVNGEEAWISYRVNRTTPDNSATVIFTPEYAGNIPLDQGKTAVVCQNGKVVKKVTESRAVPADGFILVMDSGRAGRFNIGDDVRYQTTFMPQNTSKEDWADVTEAISAGPSLIINGKATSVPANEGFTEAKILTQSAQRSFIGITQDNRVIMGTTSANINEMKAIAKELGLISATCLDGGASSGLYYNNEYMTSPGRNINNSLQFTYGQ